MAHTSGRERPQVSLNPTTLHRQVTTRPAGRSMAAATVRNPVRCSTESVCRTAPAAARVRSGTKTATGEPSGSVRTVMESCPVPKVFSSMPTCLMGVASRRSSPRSTARLMIVCTASQERASRAAAAFTFRQACRTSTANASKSMAYRECFPAHGGIIVLLSAEKVIPDRAGCVAGRKISTREIPPGTVRSGFARRGRGVSEVSAAASGGRNCVHSLRANRRLTMEWAGLCLESPRRTCFIPRFRTPLSGTLFSVPTAYSEGALCLRKA